MKPLRAAGPTSILLILVVMVWLNAQSSTTVGYAVVTADSGNPAPVGVALFTYTNSAGTLVSQAGVGLSEPIPNGRLFVDENGARTAIALANAYSQDSVVNWTLSDA